MSLSSLGWTAREADAFAPHAAAGLVPARVAVAYGATFRVYLEDEETLADVSGRLRHDARGRRDLPAVGDWVAVRRGQPADRATIHAVLPRKSVFSRKVAGNETLEQIVAANVDTAFIVAGPRPRLQPASPRALPGDDVGERRASGHPAEQGRPRRRPRADARRARTERHRRRRARRELEVRSRARGARALPGPGPDGGARRLVGRRQVDASSIACSASSGSARRRSARRISAGATRPPTASWCGCPAARCSWTRPACANCSSGRSTTACGRRSTTSPRSRPGCAFGDCRHDTEPRCAVKAAVADGRLDAARLENFHKLQREQDHLADRQDALALQEEKAKNKVVHKALASGSRKRDRSERGTRNAEFGTNAGMRNTECGTVASERHGSCRLRLTSNFRPPHSGVSSELRVRARSSRCL